jgi:hypothetical protein
MDMLYKNQNKCNTAFNNINMTGGVTYKIGIYGGHLSPTNGQTDNRVSVGGVDFVQLGNCTDVPVISVVDPIPLNHNDTSVTVGTVDQTATAVTLYDTSTTPITPLATNSSPTSPTTVITLAPGQLISGHTIAAAQTMPVNSVSTEGCPNNSATVDACSQVPTLAVDCVLMPGDTSIRVTGVDAARAEAVTIWDVSTTPATELKTQTYAVPPGPGNTTVTLTGVPALTANHRIAATQTIRTIRGCIPAVGITPGACSQIPPARIAGLVEAGASAVKVSGVSPWAELVSVNVYDLDGATPATPIGTAGAGSVVNGMAIVNVSPTLVLGHRLRALQTVNSLNGTPLTGCTADARTNHVKNSWIIEDFQRGVPAVPSDPWTGLFNTWYDVLGTAWSDAAATGGNPPGGTPGGAVPNLMASDLSGASTCMGILDGGSWNGVYAKYEAVVPAPDAEPNSNKYYLQIDMLVDERPSASTTWTDKYQAGVIVNGTPVNGYPTGIVANGADMAVGNYTGQLTTGQDGFFNETTPAIRVLTDTFVANENDSLLIAFSKQVSDYGPSGGDNGGRPAMLVDNIRLIRGQRPCLPSDVKAVSIKGPLEDGATQVLISGISQDPVAAAVSVYKYTPSPDTWTLLGTANP